MKKKIGTICMIIGATMVFAALALLSHNVWESQHAGQLSGQILAQMTDKIETSQGGTHADDKTMKEMEIDGYDYIGYLSVPSLNIELPIMSEWDYERLMIAPCRYYGSVGTHNLVLCAHNYSEHFGQFSHLNPGERIYFTDVEGNIYTYKVEEVEVLLPTAIEEMISGEYDLVLFTCTYGGASRVTVKCSRTLVTR